MSLPGCLSVCPSVCLSVCLSLSLSPSLSLPIFLPSFPSIFLSFCLSLCESVYLTFHPVIHPSIHLPSLCQSLQSSLSLFLSLSPYFHLYLSLSLSLSLSLLFHYLSTLYWEHMALNIELRHLCQRQNTGDRWRNSIFKQVVRAMYVQKWPSFLQSSALVCTHNFSSTSSCPFGDIDGASPTHSPKSGWECPHRWHKSLIPPDIPLTDLTKIYHIDGASPFILRKIYAPKTGPVSKLFQTT